MMFKIALTLDSRVVSVVCAFAKSGRPMLERGMMTFEIKRAC